MKPGYIFWSILLISIQCIQVSTRYRSKFNRELNSRAISKIESEENEGKSSNLLRFNKHNSLEEEKKKEELEDILADIYSISNLPTFTNSRKAQSRPESEDLNLPGPGIDLSQKVSSEKEFPYWEKRGPVANTLLAQSTGSRFYSFSNSSVKHRSKSLKSKERISEIGSLSKQKREYRIQGRSGMRSPEKGNQYSNMPQMFQGPPALSSQREMQLSKALLKVSTSNLSRTAMVERLNNFYRNYRIHECGEKLVNTLRTMCVLYDFWLQHWDLKDIFDVLGLKGEELELHIAAYNNHQISKSDLTEIPSARHNSSKISSQMASSIRNQVAQSANQSNEVVLPKGRSSSFKATASTRKTLTEMCCANSCSPVDLTYMCIMEQQRNMERLEKMSALRPA